MKIECTAEEKEMILNIFTSQYYSFKNIEFTIKSEKTSIKQGLLEARIHTRIGKHGVLFYDAEITKWTREIFGISYPIARVVKNGGEYEMQRVDEMMFEVDLNDLKEVSTMAIDCLNERLYEMEEV